MVEGGWRHKSYESCNLFYEYNRNVEESIKAAGYTDMISEVFRAKLECMFQDDRWNGYFPPLFVSTLFHNISGAWIWCDMKWGSRETGFIVLPGSSHQGRENWKRVRTWKMEGLSEKCLKVRVFICFRMRRKLRFHLAKITWPSLLLNLRNATKTFGSAENTHTSNIHCARGLECLSRPSALLFRLLLRKPVSGLLMQFKAKF